MSDDTQAARRAPVTKRKDFMMKSRSSLLARARLGSPKFPELSRHRGSRSFEFGVESLALCCPTVPSAVRSPETLNLKLPDCLEGHRSLDPKEAGNPNSQSFQTPAAIM